MIKNDLKTLENLPFFGISAVQMLDSKVALNGIYGNVKRWLKNEELVSLKRGLYTTRAFMLRNQASVEYGEFVANSMCQPSYVSSFYVLDGFSMLTEATRGISSATLKTPRVYQNMLGGFTYINIAPRLYTGFYQKSFAGRTIFIATRAKALFDYLWERLPNLSPENPDMVEELRINWEQMNDSDWKEFEKYCEMANNKMKRMFDSIQKYVKYNS